MKHLIELVVRYPKMVLVAVLIITGALGVGLGRLEIRNNQESELPQDDEIVETNDRIKEVFGDKAIIMIGIEHDVSIYNASTLDKIRHISEDIKAIPNVLEQEIVSLATFKNLKARDWGLERAAFLKEMPTTATAERLAQLRADVEASNDVFGRLVSKDGTFTVVVANVAEGYDQKTVSDAVFAVVEKYRTPERLYVAGTVVQAQEIDGGIQEDVGILMPTALLLVILCFYISLRTFRGVLLPMSVVLLSIVWTLGAMGWLGLPITVVSSALPALMVAVASSYGIHVMLHYYENIGQTGPPRLAVAKTLAGIGPAVIMTGATSALGAITLVVFKVASIREFGVATAIGVLSATTLSVTLMPALLALLPGRTAKGWHMLDGGLDAWLGRLTRATIQRRGWVLSIAMVTLVCVGYAGLSTLRVGQDFAKYFEPDHRLRVAFEKFDTKLGGARYLDVMIEGQENDAIQDPELLKKIYAFQKMAESQPYVGHTSSFADVVARINAALHDDTKESLRIPDSYEEIAQYMLLYSMSGNPGDQSDLVDYDYQRAKIRVMLTSSEQDHHSQLYETFKAWAAREFPANVKVEFGGDVMFWLAQTRYIVVGKIQNIIVSVLVVFLFCAFVFRSFVGGVLSVLPLTVSTLLTLSLMAMLGIRLDVGTAIITAVGVGIGVDFAIHYLKRLFSETKRGRKLDEALEITARTSGKAIVFDTFSNISGFSVFILSNFKPVQYFGWLISLMMITSALATLVILPSFISWVDRWFAYRLTRPASTIRSASPATAAAAFEGSFFEPDTRAAAHQKGTGA